MLIVTDSAADLTPQEALEWGVEIIPMYIHFSDDVIAAHDITPDVFFSRVKAMSPQIPTTSLPGVDSFVDIYTRAARDHAGVLSIHMSSVISEICHMAALAAKQTPQVDVSLIDTLTVSCGQRFQVMAAAHAHRAGWARERIIRHIGAISDATEVVYALETPDYMARSGRIGRTQLLSNSLFPSKPIIRIDKEGRYTPYGRARTMGQAIAGMARHIAVMYGVSKPLWITIIHGQMDKMAQHFADELGKLVKIGELEIRRVSPAFGVHTGPGMVGAGVVPMALMEGW